MKENAKKIRALWRKYKGLNSILAECMQRAIGVSLNERKRMLEEEFPEQAKELNDEVKERRKIRSETRRKERRTWIEHIVPLKTDAPRWKRGRRRAQEDFKVLTCMPGRLPLSKQDFRARQTKSQIPGSAIWKMHQS